MHWEAQIQDLDETRQELPYIHCTTSSPTSTRNMEAAALLQHQRPATNESDSATEVPRVADDAASNINSNPSQIVRSFWWDAIDSSEAIGAPDDDSSSSDEEDRESNDEFRNIMQRVRCLFGALTFPIPPLAAAVVITMFYFLGVAYIPFECKAFEALWNGMDVSDFPDLPTCSRPLYPYSVVTIIAFVYLTRHDLIRNALFQTERGRRLYDKVAQGMALFYVYMGILLKQTCNDDVPPGQPTNSCMATCPHLTAAFSLYIIALECFSIAIFVPLLLLPCVYLWFVRRGAYREVVEISREAAAAGRSHRGRRRRIQQVLDGLSAVQVVANANSTTPLAAMASGDQDETFPLQNKECCICMADLAEAEAVRVKNCGHVFHQACLAHWVRRRRTTCPLCRTDIRYGTFGLGHVEP